jgi:acyl dehydratase
MVTLNQELLNFVGMESPVVDAPEPVETGAVRRYAQAIMDEDPIFAFGSSQAPFDAPVAPPLFPTHMFRRTFGAPDPLTEHAADPDFDAAVGSSIRGLPELPINGKTRLNGGSEVEFFRYARHGERVRMKSRYADMTQRESSKGPMVLVVVETDYYTVSDELLMRVRSTAIYR